MSQYRQQINVILMQIKDGDKSKITDLHNLTYNHLKHVALYYIYNKNDYEDVVNEAYFRTLKYINGFNVFKDGYNWLCRIVQNVATDMNRENVHYVLCEDTSNWDGEFPDDIDQRLCADEFYRYIQTLPQLDRLLIYYRYYLDLSYGEISKKVNRSKSFVHSHLNILKEKILKNFEK